VFHWYIYISNVWQYRTFIFGDITLACFYFIAYNISQILVSIFQYVTVHPYVNAYTDLGR